MTKGDRYRYLSPMRQRTGDRYRYLSPMRQKVSRAPAVKTRPVLW